MGTLNRVVRRKFIVRGSGALTLSPGLDSRPINAALSNNRNKLLNTTRKVIRRKATGSWGWWLFSWIYGVIRSAGRRYFSRTGAALGWAKRNTEEDIRSDSGRLHRVLHGPRPFGPINTVNLSKTSNFIYFTLI